jgi:trk system potassium uptake protein TrkH
MRRLAKSDSTYVLFFFLVVIGSGALILCLPAAWSGTSMPRERLPFIDALFTATSAVCVTGLTVVDTPGVSRFGQIVILLLIQIGGLGIFSFTSLMLTFRATPAVPSARHHQSFSIEGVEHDPLKIVRNIVFFTLSIESLGAIALNLVFTRAGVPEADSRPSSTRSRRSATPVFRHSRTIWRGSKAIP